MWTPDGRRLIFTSQAGGVLGSLFWQAADGSGVAEPLVESQSIQRASGVMPDGSRVLFTQPTGLMALSLDDKRSVVPLVPAQGGNGVLEGAVSPDGRWLAYVLRDSGSPHIFVTALANPGEGRSHLTPSGGSQPRWAGHGGILFYTALDGALMMVPVAGGGAALNWGTPTQVFPSSYYAGRGLLSGSGTYDVSRDGRQFLMLRPAGDPSQSAEPATVVVVKNWGEELKRLAPARATRDR